MGRGVTAQYLNFNERRFLIDCGEGTQLQIRKYGKKLQRIERIFISHCHADHILGLPGLIATMSLLGRTNDISIYCPPALKELLDFQFKLLEIRLQFSIQFIILEDTGKNLIFEDNNLTIHSFPLKHRIECYGFLFTEKEKERNIIPEAIQEFDLKIPEIVQLKKGNAVERGAQQITPEMVTTPPPPIKKYAFCTDTRPVEQVKEWCADADLMYHEATFIEKHKDRAKKTHHTTAKEAGELATATGVKHLLLGHFSARFSDTDDLAAEAKNYHPNVTCVEDGMEFVL